ncbi:hypothetical protein ACJA88_000891 [Fusarium oxysporum]
MAADSLPNSNSKTQSSKSFRTGSPPPGRPAPGDRDMNALEHFYLSNSATGVANGNDPLGDDLGAQWEDSKKLDHQMPHHMPKLPKLN